MGSFKGTIRRGQRVEQVAFTGGSAIAGSDAVELTIDSTKMSKGDALVMLDQLGQAVVRKPYPPVAGLPPLGYTPVFMVLGDSGAVGNPSAADRAAFAGAYAPSGNILVYDQAGAQQPYQPETITGQNAMNTTQALTAPGVEAGFIARFRADRPGETLVVLKRAVASSFMARAQPPAGTFVASGSGVTLTLESGTAPAIGNLLVHPNIPAGYVAQAVSGNTITLRKLGLSGPPPAITAIPSGSTITRHPTNSWDSGDGSLWNGTSAGPDTLARFRIQRDLTAMVNAGMNPRIVATHIGAGGNDADYAQSAALFAQACTDFLARLRVDLAPWIVGGNKYTWRRTPDVGSMSQQVRAGLMGAMAGNADLYPLNADNNSRWDTLHDDLAPLMAMGSDIYDIAFNGGKGLRP